MKTAATLVTALMALPSGDTRAGYGMRIYVPYGTEWYPYFTRRIAERPANAMFVLRQFLGR